MFGCSLTFLCTVVTEAGDCMALGSYLIEEKRFDQARDWLDRALELTRADNSRVQKEKQLSTQLVEQLDMRVLYEHLAYTAFMVIIVSFNIQ